MKSAVFKWGAIATIILLAVILRLPAVDDYFCNPDVAGVAYSAQEYSIGGKLYGNSVETKPPATYLLFSTLFAVFGKTMASVQITAIIFHIFIGICIYLFAKREWGVLPAITAFFLYELYSVSSSTSGLCPNFETWPILPIALGFYLILIFADSDDKRLLVAFGVCSGIAVLFKQTVALFPLSAMVFVLYIQGKKKGAAAALVKQYAHDMFYVAFGVAIPLCAVFLYLAVMDDLGNMGRALNPLTYAGYMGSEGYENILMRIWESFGFFLSQHYLPAAGAVALLIFSFIGNKNEIGPKDNYGRNLVFFWLAAGLIAVVVPGKFFDHYFVLLEPPLALCVAYSVWRFAGRFDKSKFALPVICMLCVPAAAFEMRLEIKMGFHTVPNFARQGKPEFTVESDYFWTKSNFPRIAAWNHEMRRIGNCIEKRTDKDDTIYVWDYAPGLYWFAQRRAPTKHFMYFQVATNLPARSGKWHDKVTPRVLESRKVLMGDLNTGAPKYIVIYGNIMEELSLTQDEYRELKADFIKARSYAEAMYEPDRIDYLQYPVPAFAELDDFVQSNYSLDTQCSDKYFLSYVLNTKSAKGITQ